MAICSSSTKTHPLNAKNSRLSKPHVTSDKRTANAIRYTYGGRGEAFHPGIGNRCVSLHGWVGNHTMDFYVALLNGFVGVLDHLDVV